MHDPRPAALVALWEGAVSHLEFEMRMVHLRIEHPAVMNRANVEQLVELFSWMFNVRINNPIQCRRGVINRKLRLTRFLDLLRNSLIEESQR